MLFQYISTKISQFNNWSSYFFGSLLGWIGVVTPANRLAIESNRGYMCPHARWAICYLQRVGLSTPENVDAVLRISDISGTAEKSLRDLQHAGLLTQENLDTVVMCNSTFLGQLKPDETGNALVILHRLDLLTPENRILLTEGRVGFGSIVSLYKAGLLSQPNLNSISTEIKSSHSLEYGLFGLTRPMMLLTQVRLDYLIENREQMVFGQSLYNLSQHVSSGMSFSREDFITILQHPKYSAQLVKGYERLENENAFTPENKRSLDENAQYAASIASGMVSLDRAELYNSVNIQKLLTSVQHGGDFGGSLKALQHVDILFQDTFDTIASNAEYGCFTKLLWRLIQEQLLTRNNFTAVMEQKEHLKSLTNSFSSFNHRYGGAQDDFDSLIENAQYAYALAPCLYILRQKNLVTPQNRSTLIKIRNVKHYRFLKKGLGTITCSKLRRRSLSRRPLELTQTHFDILIQNLEYAPGLGLGLVLLHEAEILNPENQEILVTHAKYAEGLAKGLASLQKAGILTNTNKNRFIKIPKHASKIATSLEILCHTNKLNQEAFNAVISNIRQKIPSYPLTIVESSGGRPANCRTTRHLDDSNEVFAYDAAKNYVSMRKVVRVLAQAKDHPVFSIRDLSTKIAAFSTENLVIDVEEAEEIGRQFYGRPTIN